MKFVWSLASYSFQQQLHSARLSAIIQRGGQPGWRPSAPASQPAAEPSARQLASVVSGLLFDHQAFQLVG